MKVIVVIAFAGTVFGADAVSAARAGSYLDPAAAADIVAHSGGCRKDSPPGQCCHAGSKPYHCH